MIILVPAIFDSIKNEQINKLSFFLSKAIMLLRLDVLPQLKLSKATMCAWNSHLMFYNRTSD